MHFLAFNLEKFTPDRFFYTGTARGARDKYEVWARLFAAHDHSYCILHVHISKCKLQIHCTFNNVFSLCTQKTKKALHSFKKITNCRCNLIGRLRLQIELCHLPVLLFLRHLQQILALRHSWGSLLLKHTVHC